jgi:hypothetical protein
MQEINPNQKQINRSTSCVFACWTGKYAGKEQIASSFALPAFSVHHSLAALRKESETDGHGYYTRD